MADDVAFVAVTLALRAGSVQRSRVTSAGGGPDQRSAVPESDMLAFAEGMLVASANRSRCAMFDDYLANKFQRAGTTRSATFQTM
jgi:hypothetical protein